ncbi:unnamed protein product, partial [Adineta steineri]
HNQIELLIAVVRSISIRYIHKKFLYNLLKNSTNIFEKILYNQCQSNPCEHDGYCINYINLLNNQYEYLYYNTYERLIPKYKRNIKCLCKNNYYGEYCQFKEKKQSPCSSNPCLPMERCIELNSTFYTCQCMDELCNYDDIAIENSYECINTNSPTCRDSSNTLTFDGYSLIQMNLTMSIIQHLNITFSFRTELTQGKLFKLIYFNENIHSLTIQIINGYIQIELNEQILLQINHLLINDGQWHDIYFSIDYSHNYFYYLLRLDYVFSDKISLYQKAYSKNYTQLIIGSDFDGCIGNLTLNNQSIFSQNNSIEFIGTKNGCQSVEIVREYIDNDDICSLYHPCYHGGICTNNGFSFICNCSTKRFTGRQCEYDLYPCESQPCHFNKQCIPFVSNSNKSYTCIPTLISLSTTIKRSIYITLIIIIIICILLLSILYYCKKYKRKFHRNKLSVSSPLLVHKSSLIMNQIESPMDTLVKLDCDKKQTTKLITLADNLRSDSIINNYDERDFHQPFDFLNHNYHDSKYYSTIEQINALADNCRNDYTSFEYDDTDIPQTTDLFDFSSSPAKYFNIRNSDSQVNYHIRMNTLSDLTENFTEQNDIDLTESSNVSSDLDQTLLNSSTKTSDNKCSVFFNYNNNMPTSTISLSDTPMYARIVKTPKLIVNSMSTIERLRLSNPLALAPTLFIKPIDNIHEDRNRLTSKTPMINRLKHASDSDLQTEDMSSKLTSFFQTDV